LRFLKKNIFVYIIISFFFAYLALFVFVFFFLRFVDAESKERDLTLRKNRKEAASNKQADEREEGRMEGRGPATRHASLRRDSENLRVERRG
jgi:hypothetical protein